MGVGEEDAGDEGGDDEGEEEVDEAGDGGRAAPEDEEEVGRVEACAAGFTFMRDGEESWGAVLVVVIVAVVGDEGGGFIVGGFGWVDAVCSGSFHDEDVNWVWPMIIRPFSSRYLVRLGIQLVARWC